MRHILGLDDLGVDRSVSGSVSGLAYATQVNGRTAASAAARIESLIDMGTGK
ncbi:hypothetical protein [Ectopseudomonas oleovorans]|uniref:hypothetical protein n=1 Tax=Ectopseudomonas oleovorans TaxID=301 RepID=UPI001FC9E207|nr:hypothetical protein [Pseudomonas indoloxydans]